MLPIDSLIITQEVLRVTAQISGMIKFVQSGGFWTKEALQSYANTHDKRVSPQIAISRFPDGVEMIHDGHHRVTATYLGGRNYLREDEYVVTDWTYELYLEINFDQKWVTPFDPRTELRIADFKPFKTQVLELAKTDKAAAEIYIAQHHTDFCRPRLISTVSELSEVYLNVVAEAQVA